MCVAVQAICSWVYICIENPFISICTSNCKLQYVNPLLLQIYFAYLPRISETNLGRNILIILFDFFFIK